MTLGPCALLRFGALRPFHASFLQFIVSGPCTPSFSPYSSSRMHLRFLHVPDDLAFCFADTIVGGMPPRVTFSERENPCSLRRRRRSPIPRRGAESSFARGVATLPNGRRHPQCPSLLGSRPCLRGFLCGTNFSPPGGKNKSALQHALGIYSPPGCSADKRTDGILQQGDASAGNLAKRVSAETVQGATRGSSTAEANGGRGRRPPCSEETPSSSAGPRAHGLHVWQR